MPSWSPPCREPSWVCRGGPLGGVRRAITIPALCHDRRVTEHQPAHTDPYALPLGDAFIAELRARYGERCIDEVLPLPLAARPPVDYIDEALPLPPAARPPVDPDESEFDSTHDGYDDEFVFDSTHDEYDDEDALDLGGYW